MVEFDRAAKTASSPYEKWEEVYVSNDKGNREVHYYLKRRNGGGLDLALIGKEKTLRHMSYRYAFQDKERFLQFSVSSLPKLRSRREVIDWLNSIVNAGFKARESYKPAFNFSDNINGIIEDSNVVKKLDQSTKRFMWLGSPWICRKRRCHYQSFCRNGVTVAVHDFVYVLAEEGERLVAHLDDMYEDSKGNRMVVVQWFHKVEEVGIDLPQNCRDREIFFSLCLQDLSIECIDGLATVLSPEHFEKYLSEAKRTQLEPFVCHTLFDNDEIKRFDITRVEGYWKQNLLKCLSFDSHCKYQPASDGQIRERNPSDAGNRPLKRLRRCEESDTGTQSPRGLVDVDDKSQQCSGNLSSNSKVLTGVNGLEKVPASLPVKISLEQKNGHLSIGSQVEVLSQDSGIRGCWFRALIMKRHKEKVKVKYQDILDATDEAKNLEEWILASRLAALDVQGVRIYGRTVVRPAPSSNKRKVSWEFNVGTAVDVWRHGGWWEGIVVKKEDEDKFCVYFPGECQESIFARNDMRHSQEWIENGWKQLKERSDLVSEHTRKPEVVDCSEGKPEREAAVLYPDTFDNEVDQGDKLDEMSRVRDLSKDDALSQLKWKSLGRRRRSSRSPVHKSHFSADDENRVEDSRKQTYQRFFKIASSMKVDPDKCKYMGDSPFGSVVPHLTNLVMTR
ncbi:OLC1v1032323C1 [Oldenlandia corymbosa var. corymbosa]|uniref:OLC1v1032323C1 n=1 Tax=Oldenlandia corymbosa var. corymbosa TaxID=529605 RepID=A0AAV1CLC8_OLDCO|nr:OLC1v1032323C1 [Oldenlandia corymbosa var. corymbosa]